MSEPVLRDLSDDDVEAVLALNNANTPHVNAHTLESLRELVGWCVARVAEVDGSLAGFTLALVPGQPYDSLNYRWFDERMDDFLYLDRIVVAEAFRRRGVGRALHDDLAASAQARDLARITCEVNERPPNPESMVFHRAVGFRWVGSQETEGGAKEVALLARVL